MSEEENLLNARNINPTASRIIVLRYLLERHSAVSLKSLEQDLIYADRSTLYRTLKTFEKQKIIHTIDDGSGQMKYALCLETCACAAEDQHYHFHCIKCEETYCLTAQSISEIKLPTNFVLKQANLVLKGICSNCN